jgi:hypothetical protein
LIKEVTISKSLAPVLFNKYAKAKGHGHIAPARGLGLLGYDGAAQEFQHIATSPFEAIRSFGLVVAELGVNFVLTDSGIVKLSF